MFFDSLLNTLCLLVVAFNNQAKQTRLGKHANISQLHVSHGSGWRQDCLQELSLSLLDSGSLVGDLSGDGGSGDGRDKTSESTDDRGVVDDVLGHVVGDVLLDRDLGHVLDGVVNLVADMLDNGGGGDGDGSGVVSSNGGSSDNLGGGDSRSGDNLGGGGGDGVGVDSRGGGDNILDGDRGARPFVSGNRDGSLGDGVNKAVLVEVLGESLEGEGLVAPGSGDKVSDGRGEGAHGVALVDVQGGVWILDLELHPIDVRAGGSPLGGSEAGAQDSEEGDLRRKIIIMIFLDFQSQWTSIAIH